MKRTGYVGSIEETRNTYTFFPGKPEGKRPWGQLDADGRMLWRCIMRVYIGFIWLEIGVNERLSSTRECRVPRLAERPLPFQGRLRSMDLVSCENRPNCLHSLRFNIYSSLTSKGGWSMMITPPFHCEIGQWLGLYTTFQMISTRQLQ
jgi:hypothetical protein